MPDDVHRTAKILVVNDEESNVRLLERLLRQGGFVTGDILDREKREYLERTGAPTLAKPFDLVEIQRVVRRLAHG